jgi:hypothetical protein
MFERYKERRGKKFNNVVVIWALFFFFFLKGLSGLGVLGSQAKNV